MPERYGKPVLTTGFCREVVSLSGGMVPTGPCGGGPWG